MSRRTRWLNRHRSQRQAVCNQAEDTSQALCSWRVPVCPVACRVRRGEESYSKCEGACSLDWLMGKKQFITLIGTALETLHCLFTEPIVSIHLADVVHQYKLFPVFSWMSSTVSFYVYYYSPI